jgi:DNA-binding CsgD family transcriptional regulator
MSTDRLVNFYSSVQISFKPTTVFEEIRSARDLFGCHAARVLSRQGDTPASPYGIIVVDRDLQIMNANEKARHYLLAREGLSARSGKLHVGRAGVMRRIQEAVLQMMLSVPLKGLDKDLAIVGVPDSESRIRYAIRVGGALHPPDDCWVLLVVAELIDGNDVSRSELSSVFGLSEREAELAECFSKGMRVEQIAPMMGVSINTARMHLRNVFLKTGCCTQVELARVIARVPVAFSRDQPYAMPLHFREEPGGAAQVVGIEKTVLQNAPSAKGLNCVVLSAPAEGVE